MTAAATVRNTRGAITEVAMEDLVITDRLKIETKAKTAMTTADPIQKIVLQDLRELELLRIDPVPAAKTIETRATTEIAIETRATLKAKEIRGILHHRTNRKAKPFSS